MANNGKTSLFIGDLAIFCKEQDIRDVFSQCGEVLDIKIMKGEESSRHLSYGFIKFATTIAAKRAMQELDGQILCGRPLRIRWASYKNKLNIKENKGEALDTSPVHVSFISYQVERLVTEESLRQLFSKYGCVVDTSIKKSMIDQDVRRQSGYGFVHYPIDEEGINAAIRAAKALDDITVESVNYKCSISHNLNKYLTGEPIPDSTSTAQQLPYPEEAFTYEQAPVLTHQQQPYLMQSNLTSHQPSSHSFHQQMQNKSMTAVLQQPGYRYVQDSAHLSLPPQHHMPQQYSYRQHEPQQSLGPAAQSLSLHQANANMERPNSNNNNYHSHHHHRYLLPSDEEDDHDEALQVYRQLQIQKQRYYETSQDSSTTTASSVPALARFTDFPLSNEDNIVYNNMRGGVLSATHANNHGGNSNNNSSMYERNHPFHATIDTTSVTPITASLSSSSAIVSSMTRANSVPIAVPGTTTLSGSIYRSGNDQQQIPLLSSCVRAMSNSNIGGSSSGSINSSYKPLTSSSIITASNQHPNYGNTNDRYPNSFLQNKTEGGSLQNSFQANKYLNCQQSVYLHQQNNSYQTDVYPSQPLQRSNSSNCHEDHEHARHYQSASASAYFNSNDSSGGIVSNRTTSRFITGATVGDSMSSYIAATPSTTAAATQLLYSSIEESPTYFMRSLISAPLTVAATPMYDNCIAKQQQQLHQVFSAPSLEQKLQTEHQPQQQFNLFNYGPATSSGSASSSTSSCSSVAISSPFANARDALLFADRNYYQHEQQQQQQLIHNLNSCLTLSNSSPTPPGSTLSHDTAFEESLSYYGNLKTPSMLTRQSPFLSSSGGFGNIASSAAAAIFSPYIHNYNNCRDNVSQHLDMATGSSTNDHQRHHHHHLPQYKAFSQIFPNTQSVSVTVIASPKDDNNNTEIDGSRAVSESKLSVVQQQNQHENNLTSSTTDENDGKLACNDVDYADAATTTGTGSTEGEISSTVLDISSQLNKSNNSFESIHGESLVTTTMMRDDVDASITAAAGAGSSTSSKQQDASKRLLLQKSKAVSSLFGNRNILSLSTKAATDGNEVAKLTVDESATNSYLSAEA